MATGWWFVIAGWLGVAIANLRTMRPLWASPALERSQKIAQTVLMWLVPGSYLAVRRAILPGIQRRPLDATRGLLGGDFDWPSGHDAPGPHHGHPSNEGHRSSEGHHDSTSGGHGGDHSDGGGHGGH